MKCPRCRGTGVISGPWFCAKCNGKGVIVENSWECGLRKIEQGEKTWRRKQSVKPEEKPADPRRWIAVKVGVMHHELMSITQDLDAYGIGSRNVRQAADSLKVAYEKLSE